jgi:Ca2+-transporting ATPase
MGGAFFRTVPLSLSDWLMIIGGTSMILWLGELQRGFVKITLNNTQFQLTGNRHSYNEQ